MNKVIESEMLQMAGNLLMSVSKDENERAVFRSRRMYQSDLESNIATAEDRGRAEGELARALSIAKNALRKGMSIEDVIDITGLTREEIEALQD